MINIKETVKTPSRALELMIEGVEAQLKRPDFKLNMGSYGNYYKTQDGVICGGCAATCTIQAIAQKNLTPANIKYLYGRAYYLSFYEDELEEFEMAINSARSGIFSPLVNFFQVYESHPHPGKVIVNLEKLGKDIEVNSQADWEEQLPKIKKVITYLKSNNL